jgi:protoporphyrinogen/coproporphyrinogen III oxidase
MDHSERGSSRDRVVIVGAGLTGLAAAHRLVSRSSASRRPTEVVVLEAKDRVGGAVWTDRAEGFTLEGGADSFITNKPWALNLCRELGLSDQIIGTDTRNRRSFVVRKGKLEPVPEGFVLMAPGRLLPLMASPILSIRGKLRMLMDLILPRKADDTDESLAAFVRRRLGREALERLVQPLVGGIYTADPAELSLKATLPQYLAMEREHGSLILGAVRQAKQARSGERAASGARYGMFASLADGMDTLPNTLLGALPPRTVRTGTSVRRIGRPDPGKPWVVELLDGPPIEAGGVILTTEGHASARLIDGFDPELALQLRSIPYASSAIVTVAYPRDRVAHPLDGFGVVVPAIEGRSILAASFLNVKFPSRAPIGTALIRVFVGGATQPGLFDLDDDELKTLVRGELTSLLGVSGEPILIEVARHARAMPQYTLGHLDRIAAIQLRAAQHSRLLLAGNAFNGVGIPDCIRSGQEAAAALLRALADPAAPAAA